MSQTETSERSESGGETARTAAGRGREYVSKVAPYLRRGVESGALIAIAGGTGFLGGLRALRSGERERALPRLAAGAALLTAAFAQWRSRSHRDGSEFDATDVADSGPDVGAVADEAGGVGEDDHAEGEAAGAVVDTSPDVEDASSGIESDSDDAASASVDQHDVADIGVDGEDIAETTEGETEERETGDDSDVTEAATEVETETEDVDRLGEAAFDGQSREVPVPQRAFNQGFLAHSTEAAWGIRESDDAVLVSRDFDAVQGRDGVKYVASSEIGDDARELPVPNAIVTHWDDVYGGGTAVAGGDDVLFVTTDDLAADHLLRVLPAAWADEAFGDAT